MNNIIDFRKLYPDAIVVYYTNWKDKNFAICSGITPFEKYLNGICTLPELDLRVYAYITRLSEWSENADNAWQSAFDRVDQELIGKLSI